MKIRSVSALAMALTLVACGGGSTSTPTPTPTSTGSPTPTPSPSPTPTPAPYTKFADLTGDQQFKAGCGGLYGPSERIDAFGFGRADTVPGALSIDFADSTDAWTLAGEAYSGTEFSFTFTPAMIQPNPPEDAVYYRKDNPDGSAERFYLSARKLGGTAPDYVRGSLLTYRIGSAAPEYRYCVFGVPTRLDDTTPSSTVTYGNVAVGGVAFTAGAAITQYDLSESTVTVSANPTTGEIPVVLKLVGRAFTPTGLSDTRVALGEYRGTATIDGSDQSFNDALTDADRALLGGNFGGWFFGPQGIEIGFAFSVKAQNADGSTITAAGAVTGRR